MTIEIHQPEIEALIKQRMETGKFRSVEEVLLHALQAAPYVEVQQSASQPKKNLAQFLLDSPLPGSELDLERVRDYPHPVEL